MKLLIAVLAVMSPLCAQVNFHGSIEIDGARSKPAQSGTALPGTCVVGDQYFKTDATAGQNLYGCTSTNTWTQQAGGGGTTSGSMLPQVTGTLPGTTLTVGASCPAGANCGGTFGATTRSWTTAPTIQITAASGSTTVRIWMANSGNVIFNYDNTIITAVTLGSGITGDTSSTAFPVDVLPLASCAVTGVNFTSCTDLRYPKTNTLTAGTGPATVTATATGNQIACPTCFDTSSFNDITQASAPSAPSAGSVRVYGKTGTATLCSKDSTNTETCYGAGGASTITEYRNETYAMCNAATSGLVNMRGLNSATITCQAGNNNNEALVRFVTNVDTGWVSTELPSTWTGSITYKMTWVTWTAGSGADQVKWQFETKCYTGGSIDSFASPNTTSVTQTPSTAVRGRSVASVTLNTTGCTAGDTLLMRISRVTPAGTDYADAPGAIRGVWQIQHN